MIFKSFELNKIDKEKFSLFLFYGKNNHQKNSEFNKLIDNQSEVIKYEEKDLIDKQNLNVDVEIDGGINFENCSKAKDAGANILVSGSTIFKENKGDLKKNIEILRNN